MLWNRLCPLPHPTLRAFKHFFLNSLQSFDNPNYKPQFNFYQATVGCACLFEVKYFLCIAWQKFVPRRLPVLRQHVVNITFKGMWQFNVYSMSFATLSYSFRYLMGHICQSACVCPSLLPNSPHGFCLS